MELLTPEMGIMFWTIFTLLLLVFPLVALIILMRSNKETTEKLLWVLIILFIPVLGFILYFAIGNGRKMKTA